MNTQLRKTLADLLQGKRDEIVRITQDLVRIPSYESEKGVADYIASYLKDRDIPFDRYEPDVRVLKNLPGFVPVGYDYTGRENISVTIGTRDRGRSIGLNGHIDTVPYDENGRWITGDPLSGHIEGNKLYGRGSEDMKCGAAIMLVLLDLIHQHETQLCGQVQFHFVVDEENGGNGTLAALERGYRPDTMVFLESTAPGILIAAGRGAQFFRITVKGQEVSVLRAKESANAVEMAAYLLRKIEDYAQQREADAVNKAGKYYALFPQLNMALVPLNICSIHGGNWPSTLPASITMEGTIECLPCEDIEQVKKDFKNYIYECCAQDERFSRELPQFEWFGLCFESAQNEEPCVIAEIIKNAAQQMQGISVITAGAGGSDLRLPLLYYGIPSVLYGAAGSGEHAENEYADIESFVPTAIIVAATICDFLDDAERS